MAEPVDAAATPAATEAVKPPRSGETAAQGGNAPEAVPDRDTLVAVPDRDTPVAEDTAGEQPTTVAADAAVPAQAAKTQPAGASRGIVVALLVVSFVLEVALLGALGIWGLVMLPLGPAMALIVTVVPLLVFWTVFMSPKASLRLPQPYHAVLAHLLFATGAGLLAIAGQPVLAVCMGVLTAISLALTVAVRGRNVAGGKKATGRRAAR